MNCVGGSEFQPLPFEKNATRFSANDDSVNFIQHGFEEHPTKFSKNLMMDGNEAMGY